MNGTPQAPLREIEGDIADSPHRLGPTAFSDHIRSPDRLPNSHCYYNLQPIPQSVKHTAA